MHEVASAFVALGQPFVLMGDFNMSPSEFVQGSFLDSVKGVLLAPDEPTFQAVAILAQVATVSAQIEGNCRWAR